MDEPQAHLEGSWFLPALDEQDEIGNTVSSAAAVLRSAGIAPFEVIVIDDGSTDATAERARAARARVITHVQNLGYGRSLKDGIAAAQYDCIVISDADGTIKEMPGLIARYRCGFDMVVGARSGEHYRQDLHYVQLRLPAAGRGHCCVCHFLPRGHAVHAGRRHGVVAILIFTLGLLAVLLKQIMDK